MKTKFLTTTLAAGAIALAGTAFAQSSPSTSPSTGGGSTMERPSGTAPGGSINRGAGSGSTIDRGAATSPNAARPDNPPAAIVGKDVVNAAGDKIGEVKSVSGKQVIVGVGGFLGMGEREVALDWAQLTQTGSGEDMKLKTSMTKDQLKELPEHKADRSSSGSRSTSGSGAGGTR